MNVLVESSAWIDFLNGSETGVAATVQELLRREDSSSILVCGLIVTEVLQGLRRPGEFPRVQRLLADLSFRDPAGFATYVRAAELFRRLRERGVTVRSTVDCLIAVVAEENGGLLLARDRDLERIVASGLVDVRLWPG